MFEKFTENGRKAFAIANREAQRFHHEGVETEHVLLGLIKEGESVTISGGPAGGWKCGFADGGSSVAGSGGW